MARKSAPEIHHLGKRRKTKIKYYFLLARHMTSTYRKAAGCIVRDPNNKDSVLLIRRSKHETSFHGLWELPGGKVENGEKPHQTAINETVEETSLSKLLGTAVLLEPHIDHDMEKIYYGYVVDCIKSRNTPNVVLSDEHDAYMWITLEGALKISPLSHHAHFLLSQLNED